MYQQNINKQVRGDTMILPFVYTDKEDITGKSFCFTIKNINDMGETDDDAILQLLLVIPEDDPYGLEGKAIFWATSEEMNLVPTGLYKYDIQEEYQGVVNTVMFGQISFQDDVTKSVL